MLYAIDHDLPTKLWCGPAAFSTLTGLPTSRLVNRLKTERGGGVVKNVYTGELLRALRAEGLGTQRVPAEVSAMTLAASLPLLARVAGKKPILVNVTDHYVVIEGRWLIDNQTKVAVRLKDAPHRRKRVKYAWVIDHA